MTKDGAPPEPPSPAPPDPQAFPFKAPPLTPPLCELLTSWLQPVLAQLPTPLPPDDAALFQKHLTAAAIARARAFIAGVRAYQTAPTARAADPDDNIVWRAGTTLLRRYGPEDGPALLVIPSLVNRFTILDLEPDHSFLRHLAKEGFSTYVVDWDFPGDEEKTFDLSAYMTKRLDPILTFLQDRHPSGVHLVGYCMGGLLALALAALSPQATKSLTLMATPWDFFANTGGPLELDADTRALFTGRLEEVLETLGYLPVDLLQSLFVSFQPLQILEKFRRFARKDSRATNLARFVLTEDWLNDGVPLAGGVAKETLLGWYGENAPARGTWCVAGHKIDPAQLKVPCYVLIPGRDRIVPPEQARPLAAALEEAGLAVVRNEPPLGHVGLMVSDDAPQKVWAPLAAWLAAQEAPKPRNG